MAKRINCFIPYGTVEAVRETIGQLSASPLVGAIYVISNDPAVEELPGAEIIWAERIHCTSALKAIAQRAESDYALIYTKPDALALGLFALERLTTLADDTEAGMLYTDHYVLKGGQRSAHPVIDYQPGSLRDDFDFGALQFYRSDLLREAVEAMTEDYQFAALYDLRLRVSCKAELTHVSEYLYTEVEHDLRKSGEKQFDYVDPRNRAVQIEMEAACTAHLKRIGAYLPPVFEPIAFSEESFEVEASVIIPVRNRARTIEDAVRSALNQQTDFPFNVIVIDNHSTDGTTEKLAALAAKDPRVLHLVPEREDLGIGGCWNLGIHHTACGRFAVQLDSDDVYNDCDTLRKIVAAFYEQQCAMVVGTYRMTNFQMETIPPGVIDHKEWTPENGRNNALRINGLGAPRAFYTPLLRKVNLPNTSYGEDYALGLRMSRRYQIGRIYDVLYLCRRWEDNSDASLDVVKMNQHNLYKDKIRTWELFARIHQNRHHGTMA